MDPTALPALLAHAESTGAALRLPLIDDSVLAKLSALLRTKKRPFDFFLDGADVSGAGVVALANVPTKVCSLSLKGCQGIDDHAGAVMAPLGSSLRSLNLQRTRMTDPGIFQVLSAFRMAEKCQLEELHLPHVGRDGVSYICDFLASPAAHSLREISVESIADVPSLERQLASEIGELTDAVKAWETTGVEAVTTGTTDRQDADLDLLDDEDPSAAPPSKELSELLASLLDNAVELASHRALVGASVEFAPGLQDRDEAKLFKNELATTIRGWVAERQRVEQQRVKASARADAVALIQRQLHEMGVGIMPVTEPESAKKALPIRAYMNRRLYAELGNALYELSVRKSAKGAEVQGADRELAFLAWSMEQARREAQK